MLFTKYNLQLERTFETPCIYLFGIASFHCMICSWVHTALFFTFIEENSQQFAAKPQFPAKWCLRNMRRNSLLMMWLGSASDFLKLLHPVRSTTSGGSRPWDGGGHKKFFFRPQFGLKISGVRGALGPLAPPLDPRLTTQIWVVTCH